MRNFMKLCTFLSVVALCVFGAFTLKDEIYRVLPQQKIETPTNAEDKQESTTDKNATDEKEQKPVFQHPQLVIDGELTEGTTNLVFIHENGFEVGKSKYKNATAKPNVQNDDKKRLHRYAVRIAPENITMYTSGPEEGPTEPQAFAKDAPTIPITSHTWRYAVQPYLNAVTDFVYDNKIPIVFVVECRYNTANDTVPHYIDLKVFSPDDLGKSCSIWVTFYNTDPTRQLNYVSGQWLTTVAPDDQGGDVDG